MCIALDESPPPRIGAIMAGAVGFVFGVLYSPGGLVYDCFAEKLNAGTALAFHAIWGVPVLFAIAGFFAAAIAAVLYNRDNGVVGLGFCGERNIQQVAK